MFYTAHSQPKQDIKVKKIFIGKGVAYYKNKQALKWKEIQEKLGYETIAATQKLISKEGGTLALAVSLAHAFGVTPAEFIEQCTVEEVKK